MMVAVVVLAALFLVGTGLWGVTSPSGVIRFSTRWQSRDSIAVAFLFHLVIGAALFFAASHAWHPAAFQVVAIVCFVLAVTLLSLGFAPVQQFLSRWLWRLTAIVFWLALVALLVGAYLLPALSVPIISSIQDASSLATIVGIGIGAAWAIWSWWHQESLRRIKEDPGLAFTFSWSQSTLRNGGVLVTLQYTVRNTGVLPVFPVAEQASFRIGHLVSCDAIDAFLTKDSPVEDEKTLLCAPNTRNLRLEPQTDTVFVAHYIAAHGHLYAVTFTLPSTIPTEDGTHWIWKPWRVIHVSEETKAPA